MANEYKTAIGIPTGITAGQSSPASPAPAPSGQFRTALGFATGIPKPSLMTPAPNMSVAPTATPAPVSSPVPVAPAVVTPPPFKANVPTTLDSGTAASSLSGGTPLPPVIPPTSDTAIYQMNDGRFYNPALGLSGATRESVMAPPAGGAGVAPSTSTGAAPGAATTTTPSAATTAAQHPADDVTAAIQALFPNSDTLVKQYQDMRTAAGLPAQEAELADVNKQIGDMNAVIQNIENDVRTQAAGQADESFIQATVADRIRRLQPRIDQLNARQAALQGNIQAVKENITTQLGLSQQDIQNAATDRTAVRDGIKQLLDTYGSAAFANVDPAVIAELEKRAGLPAGSISAQSKTLAESKQAASTVSFQELNGHIYKLDSASGKVEDTGIVVPPDQKDTANQAIQVAQILQNSDNPDAALKFLQTFLPGNVVGTAPGEIDPNDKVGTLPDDRLATLLAAMAQREGYGSDASNRPTRDNNPGDIKVPAGGIAEAQARYGDPGATVDPVPATDGGMFIKFSTPEAGFRAMGTLLKSGAYSGLSIDAALKKWSGGGYGAEIVKAAPASAAGLKKPASGANAPIGAYTADQFKALNTLNDNINSNQVIKNYTGVKTAYQQIISGAQQGSGPGDIQLIVGLAKLNDPTTGVREGEYKTVQSALPLIQSIVNIPSKLVKGTQLTPEGRQAIVDAATAVYNKQIKNFNEQKDVFVKQATKAGLDPADLVLPTVEGNSGEFSVVVQGQKYVFPSQDKLDAFKKQAGLS